MAADSTIVDTGPLVALLNSKDSAHVVCGAAITGLRRPLISSWAVLAEAAWLLKDTQHGLERLLRMVSEGVVECPLLNAAAAAWIAEQQQRYFDLQPQLADLTLLYLARQQGTNNILTLDRRDFLVYLNEEGKAFRLIPENVG